MGLDKLYSHMIAHDLEMLATSMHEKISKDKIIGDLLLLLSNDMKPLSSAIATPAKFYTSLSNKGTKVWPQTLGKVLEVGQKQIIRKHIAHELNTSCQFKSQQLSSSLRAFNE